MEMMATWENLDGDKKKRRNRPTAEVAKGRKRVEGEKGV